MSMSTVVDFHRGKSGDGYQASPPIGSASGFLTPPSPFNLEGRRDSIASSQSSMTSFGSYTSDYSVPVTPTCGRSPLNDDGFVDVMAYDLGHDIQNQPSHGLSVSHQPKGFGSEESLYGQWVMVQHQVEHHAAQMIQLRPQDILSNAGGFLQPQMTDHNSLEGAMVPSAENSWGNFSTVGYQDFGRQVGNNLLEPTAADDNLRTFWDNQIQHAQSMSMDTMIPSDAMLDVDTDYVHVHPDSFDDMNTYEESSLSLPQSPQEVSFKRESSAPVKQEPESDEGEVRMKRSIYVSPTGGKSVKKERRAGSVSKKRSKAAKHKEFVALWRDSHISFKMEGFDYNHETGEFESTNGDGRTKHRCHELDAEGRRCTKVFQRPEHLKRHLGTHSGERNYSCVICQKPFNRNDNCQEHYWTHVRKPGKKDGRNPKMPLREVEERIMAKLPDQKLVEKLIEKLRQKWKNEVDNLNQDEPLKCKL